MQLIIGLQIAFFEKAGMGKGLGGILMVLGATIEKERVAPRGE